MFDVKTWAWSPTRSATRKCHKLRIKTLPWCSNRGEETEGNVDGRRLRLVVLLEFVHVFIRKGFYLLVFVISQVSPFQLVNISYTVYGTRVEAKFVFMTLTSECLKLHYAEMDSFTYG